MKYNDLVIAFKDDDINTYELSKIGMKLITTNEYFDGYYNDSRTVGLIKFKTLNNSRLSKVVVVLFVWIFNIINYFRIIGSNK